jgi:hypothetical protein
VGRAAWEATAVDVNHAICIDAVAVVVRFNAKILAMTVPTFSLFRGLSFASALMVAFIASTALYAQEANILGLPAVPQPKPGSTPAAPASGASAAAKSGSASTTPNDRAVLTGELGVQHSSREGIGRIIFTTKAAFQTAGARSEAIDAAKSVQQGLQQSCLKQCKPVKMSAPKILASGQLEFELAFRPLHQTLSQGQFVAALQSRPLELTTAQLTAPVAVAAPPQVNVQAAPAPASTPATASHSAAPASN